jgi:hypothetical protein
VQGQQYRFFLNYDIIQGLGLLIRLHFTVVVTLFRGGLSKVFVHLSLNIFLGENEGRRQDRGYWCFFNTDYGIVCRPMLVPRCT